MICTTIASININGGTEKKYHEIKGFITQHNIDVLLIQEARITPSDISTINKLFKPFKCYYALGSSSVHGNITIIQPKLKHYVIDATQSRINPSDGQYLTLPINNNVFCIANTYLTSHYTDEHNNWTQGQIHEIENYMNRLPYSYKIIGGDLNVDMTANTHRAILLRSMANRLGMKVNIPDCPTHNKGNTLDYFIASSQISQEFEVISDGAIPSDHLPIILRIRTQQFSNTHRITRYSNINTQSLRTYSKNLDRILNLNTKSGKKNDLNNIVDAISIAAESSFKKTLTSASWTIAT